MLRCQKGPQMGLENMNVVKADGDAMRNYQSARGRNEITSGLVVIRQVVWRSFQ